MEVQTEWSLEDSTKSGKALSADLEGRGLSLTAETFIKQLKGRWQFWSSFGSSQSIVFDNFIGDFHDLGAGAWVINGTASGSKENGSPVSSAYLLEYVPSGDILNWHTFTSKISIANASSPSSPIQIQLNVPAKSILLIVRANRIFFPGTSYYLEANSYYQTGID
jgi:hypothetical protein